LIYLFLLLTLQAKNLTYQQVVKDNFPDCSQKKKVHYLTKDEVKKIESKTDKKLYSKIIHYYEITCKKQKKFAYIDSHIVRTLNETIVATVENDTLTDYQVASFMEPMDYKAHPKWLGQFKNKKTSITRKLYENVDGISGATLTANATVDTVNKISIIHQTIHEKNL
jgi:hypothetical protein